MADLDTKSSPSEVKKPRSSRIEVANRVEAVAKLRLNGGRMDDVVALAAKEKWGVGRGSIKPQFDPAGIC